MSEISFLENKTILITGGSGSIGSYLVDALMKTNCKTIRVLANSEYELYTLQKKYGNNRKLRFLLGDVRDKGRLIVASEGVNIVFHAAALKHVPLCEFNPFDAIQTNVIGTQNMIEACIHSDVEKFVFISTDKAASPQSTLGATKLLAERLTISAMAYRRSLSKPIMYCIRFGNVLGTRGSVLELFLEQVHDGKPLTITDKEMTRFTMTQKDAVNLILSTVNIAQGGEIFVLKMKAMKIIDLARAVIELYSKNPQKHEIIETGIREGEKLHEDLISREEVHRVREFDSMYVIPPQNSKAYDQLPSLKSPYSSNLNDFMSIDSIKSMLKESVGK
ncbi:MAG: polysaccharide biosynthesis protein [Candidatus Nitrosotenuis sp.]